jgi:hypothetical protein
VITFFLSWFTLSLAGTLVAVTLIRAGKKHQPGIHEAQPVTVRANAGRTPYNR